MKNTNGLIASALVVTATSLSISTAQAESISMDFGIIDNNGNCGIALPFDGNKKLELSVRSKDGNVNVRVQNLPSDLVRAGVNKDNVPITLDFDTGDKFSTDVGYYSAGFRYEARGYWNDAADGAPVMRAFKNAKNITIKMDGKSYGPVSTQATSINMAWSMITTCVERNGGVMPGDDG